MQGKQRRRASWMAIAGVLSGVCGATVTTPRNASAFCGFYVSGSSEGLFNDATRVALMREGERTALTMQNSYKGPPENFAMVVPVPVVLQEQNVKTLPMNVFDHLEALTAPRLVEYWEQDPCYVPPPVPRNVRRYASGPAVYPSAPVAVHSSTVRVEAQFTVGEYEIVILSASESTGLETWLRENKYNIPQGAAHFLEPYIREQSKFFVAKVDIQKVQRDANGGALLSPLRFHYDSREFRLPVRLGLLNASNAQDLIVYVLSTEGRYEVANYRNVFIPTNLDVADGVRSQFGAFYSRLFDATMATPGPAAVVTEYAWATNSCDPCPTPPLDDSELNVLGQDVLHSATPSAKGIALAPSRFVGPMRYNNGMVVSRLHTRYNRATLTEDLVFQRAQGVTGGREFARSANGDVEQGALPSESSNFQARYIIRHPWQGAITCRNPRRGIWGGPPNGGGPTTTAARNLSQVPNADIQLPPLVKTATPGVDLNARLVLPTPPPLPPDPIKPDAGTSSTSSSTSSPTTAPPAQRGCACSTLATHSSNRATCGWGAALVAGVCLALVSRSRRRAR